MFNIQFEPPNAPAVTSFMMFAHRRSLLDLCPDPDGVKQAKFTPTTPDHPATTKTDSTPWLEWGPPVTRCFNLNALVTRWITTTAGQRYAIFLASSSSLVFLDFNPVRIKRLGVERAATQTEEPHVIARKTGNVRTWLETNPNTIRHHTFMEPVVSRLPYVVCSLEKINDYAGVLLDEHRLIGLQACLFPSSIPVTNCRYF
jgi:hypothetical protein